MGLGDLSWSALPLRRRRVLWLIAGGAALVSSAGVASARFVRSPAQAAAETAPPPRTLLTAPVQRRVLSDTVILRGQVSAGTTVELTPTPKNVDRPVVTAVQVQPGAKVSPGTVIMEVSGRPLIVLPGQVPAYRDLRPGMRGRDVEHLQKALTSLGHRCNPNGTFDLSTKKALTSLYNKLGYSVVSAGDAAMVAASSEAVTRARRAFDEAREHLDRLLAAPPATPPPGEPHPVDEARKRLRFAAEDLAAAQARHADLERESGPMLPSAEVAFLPEFPARVEKLSAAVGTVVSGPILTLSSGALVVRAEVNVSQRRLLAVGMPAEIVSETTGDIALGAISHIGDLIADEQGTRFHPTTIEPTGQHLPDRLASVDVRLTVEVARTDEEVLVVPLAAVHSGADGRTAVLRTTADGGQERVQVSAGVTGDGYVSVTPTAGSSLAPGDRVIVGTSTS